jgi:hypothetical protein
MFIKTLLLGPMLGALWGGHALAGSIANGGFDSDLADWSTVLNGGSVAWSGGHAVLATGAGTGVASAVLIQGDDGTFTFASPITLGADDRWFRFDAVFSALGLDGTEDPLSGFSDQLNVWIFDADSLDTWLAGAFSLSDPGGADLSFDLVTPADLRGKRVAFSFELTDEADGQDSQVSIDNVRIERGAVAEPGTLALIAGALSALGLARGSRRRRSSAD